MEETVEDFYKCLLKKGGIWEVLKIMHKNETEEVSVEVGINFSGIKAKHYDFRIRRWRYLNSMSTIP